MQSTASVITAAALSALLTASDGSAQSYPDRPVRIVVPFPPGGNTDITGRIIAQAFTEQMKQSFFVDNRAGAGGMIGGEIVAKAQPDGYTLLIGTSGATSISPQLYAKPLYDTFRDFTPISLLALAPIAILAHPSVPAKNLHELIALAKSRPGQLTLASAGTGTSSHLSAELLLHMTGMRMTHVPYKGGGPAIVDLVSGQVAIMFEQVTATIGYVKQGRLRVIAVTSAQRLGVLPEVPTVMESGVKDYEASTYNGLMAPAGTPKPIVDRLYAEAARAVKTATVRERFEVLGAEARSMPPEEFQRYLRTEHERWARAIKLAQVKVN
jgi:tripartite-type tricarboxylate transporter receptor subunit TctC